MFPLAEQGKELEAIDTVIIGAIYSHKHNKVIIQINIQE